MATPSRIILITGGNSGIGFETAAQLLADKSNHVIIGSRSAQKGEAALKELESLKQPGSAETIELDVANPDSINAAAKKVEKDHQKLDALVNNAGIGAFPEGTPLHEQMTACFATNATGPAVMGEAFAPLLQKSTTTPRLVNVTSGAGSIGVRLNPSSPLYGQDEIQYRASKSAMNMVTANQSVKFGQRGIKVFAYCPGFTVSNLSWRNKAENGAKPTSEGARPLVAILNGERDEEHGGYLNGTGQYPW